MDTSEGVFGEGLTVEAAMHACVISFNDLIILSSRKS